MRERYVGKTLHLHCSEARWMKTMKASGARLKASQVTAYVKYRTPEPPVWDTEE